MKTYFQEKTQILETWLQKLGCHGKDTVDVYVMMILVYSPIILVKVAKFGGHSLYGFKVIKLFKERGLGLNRDKITTTTTLLTLSST